MFYIYTHYNLIMYASHFIWEGATLQILYIVFVQPDFRTIKLDRRLKMFQITENPQKDALSYEAGVHKEGKLLFREKFFFSLRTPP